MAGPKATDLCLTVGAAWSQQVLGCLDAVLGLVGDLRLVLIWGCWGDPSLDAFAGFHWFPEAVAEALTRTLTSPQRLGPHWHPLVVLGIQVFTQKWMEMEKMVITTSFLPAGHFCL